MELTKNIAKHYKLSLFIIISIVYLQVFTFDLSYYIDDTLLDNYKSGFDISLILPVNQLNSEDESKILPLTGLTYIFNSIISGQSLYTFQLTNLIILLFLSFFFVKILKSLHFENDTSSLITILIATNPVLLYYVAWIPGREILLSALFASMALYFTIKQLNYRDRNSAIYGFICIFLGVLSSFDFIFYIAFLIVVILIFFKEETKDNQGFVISFITFGVIFNLVIIYLYFPGLFSNIDLILLLQKSLNIFGSAIFPFATNNAEIFNPIRILLSLLYSIMLVLIYLKIDFHSKYALASLISFSLFLISNVLNFQPNNLIHLSGNGILFVLISITFTIIPFISKLLKSNAKLVSIFYVVILGILSFSTFFGSRIFENKEKFYTYAFQHNVNDDIINKLVEINVQNRNIKNAESILSNVKESKNLAKSWIAIGDYYYSMFDYNNSIYYFDKAVKSDSNNVNAKNLLINSYFQLKNYSKAIDLLKPLAYNPSKYPDAKWDLLNIYLEAKLFEDARPFALASFTTNDDIIRALQLIDNWSKIYYQEPDNPSVVKVMKLGLELDPDNAIILNYLYDTYMKIGLRTKAIEYEKRLKKIFNEQIQKKKK
ncbi:hypothetical protein MASR1M45_26780 [Candidatus Kapaibacterium sp.]